MSNHPVPKQGERNSAVGTRTSRLTAAAEQAAANGPTHIVLFKQPGEDNEKALNKTMQARAMTGVAELSSGARVLETDDGRDVRLYKPLGVAAATLTDDEIDDLMESGIVRNVYRNGTRYLPRPVQIQLVGDESSIFETRSTQTPRVVDRELVAYMRGQRDSIDNLLRWYTGMPPELAPHSREAAALERADRSWCLDMIGVHATTETGRGIVVAVLDTGVDLTHPDLAGHFADQSANFESFVDEEVQDLNGHGTHCCGIVAGAIRPKRGPRYGVAPDVTLLAGKVLTNSGRGRDDQIIEGLMWAASRGANVISLSLGSPRSSGALPDEAYAEIGENLLMSKDIMLVAAAGNESDRTAGHIASVCDPAASGHYFAVAALDRDRQVGWFSCGGPEMDIAAPGVDVYSAYKRAGYAKLSGTSMATPHVAGAAAIWAQRTGLRGDKLQQLLRSKAERVSHSSADVGAGLVRV